MQRSTERILTTHTGSIPRPPELLALSSSKTGPPKDPALLRRAAAAVRAQSRAPQAEIGIDIVSDGEFGKDSWGAYILERISGFENCARDQLRELEWLGRERETFAEFLAEAFPRAVTGVPTRSMRRARSAIAAKPRCGARSTV